MNSKRILVLGDGGWGTALALVLHHNGHKVTLWSKFPEYAQYVNKKRENPKFLPGVKLPGTLSVTSELIIHNADLIVMAVPTQFCRGVLEELRSTLYARSLPRLLRDSMLPPIVSVAKGIEQTTLKRPSEIIKEVLDYPKDKIAVLSGPSHAEEVARKKPASVVVASSNKKLARDLQAIFSNEYFRVYTQDDVVGVETAAAVKNIIAIAAGICDGLGLGDNAKSALLTRGMVEISRLGEALGGNKKTFFGLAGIGDLITTCISPHGRNRAVGVRIGKGETLTQILKSMQQVAEGVWTTKAVMNLVKKYKVEMPITTEVYNILFKNRSPIKAVYSLMTRKPKGE
jgi:glycerol-3-phosphate dehydrogenase (NAD(P)+)